MSTYTVVGSGPEVPCSQSQHRMCHHTTSGSQRLQVNGGSEESAAPVHQPEPEPSRVCLWGRTCRQMARLTLQPNAVLTDRGWRPRSLKSLEKECVSDILGRSSATTTQARTRDRSRPRACSRGRLVTRLRLRHLISPHQKLVSLFFQSTFLAFVGIIFRILVSTTSAQHETSLFSLDI